MYYLQSRYYDATICRFINADGYVSTGQGILGNNMFAYCNNNPVMGYDPTGEYCVANKDEADTNYLDDWLIEGAGVSGGSIGGFGGGNSVATNIGSLFDYNSLTSGSAKSIASNLGYNKVNGQYSHGSAVYYNPNVARSMQYISLDVDSHNGGYWKVASSIKNLLSKTTRTGTFSWDLKDRIGD